MVNLLLYTEDFIESVSAGLYSTAEDTQRTPTGYEV
jgi:hypothetical protein